MDIIFCSHSTHVSIGTSNYGSIYSRYFQWMTIIVSYLIILIIEWHTFPSDVNKDWTPKDKDKDLTLKDKDKDLTRVA